MRKRIALTAPLLLLVALFCHAQVFTLAEADTIIVVLIVFVIVLLVLGGFGLHYNRVISRRNEQLLRILNALDDYRAIVAGGALSLDNAGRGVEGTAAEVESFQGCTDGRQSGFLREDGCPCEQGEAFYGSWFQPAVAGSEHLTISTPYGLNMPQRY